MTSRRTQLYVIAYDISDNKRRRRVATLLEARAARVQDSVFEERMTSRTAYALFAQLKALCTPDDCVRLYPVPDAALPHAFALGGPAIAAACRYWLV